MDAAFSKVRTIPPLCSATKGDDSEARNAADGTENRRAPPVLALVPTQFILAPSSLNYRC